jgi:hypothetical protein
MHRRAATILRKGVPLGVGFLWIGLIERNKDGTTSLPVPWWCGLQAPRGCDSTVARILSEQRDLGFKRPRSNQSTWDGHASSPALAAGSSHSALCGFPTACLSRPHDHLRWSAGDVARSRAARRLLWVGSSHHAATAPVDLFRPDALRWMTASDWVRPVGLALPTVGGCRYPPLGDGPDERSRLAGSGHRVAVGRKAIKRTAKVSKMLTRMT